MQRVIIVVVGVLALAGLALAGTQLGLVLALRHMAQGPSPPATPEPAVSDAQRPSIGADSPGSAVDRMRFVAPAPVDEGTVATPAFRETTFAAPAEQIAALTPPRQDEDAPASPAPDGAGAASLDISGAALPADKAGRDPRAAKQLFGTVKTAAALQARAIGFYSRGCLAGARPLAIDGPAWQAMRLSRNRNWGHPKLVSWIERFAKDAKQHDGWPGLLVGDISQPRGGPMLTGHASHQIGLDADIWFTPMPDRRLTEKEREELAASSMLADKITVDPQMWTATHVKLVKRAASYRDVERVLVHPAIKKALCDGAAALGPDRGWLHKVRPIWGHFYHFHVRMTCPADSPNCRAQGAPGHDDGCGKELTDWFALLTAPPKPAKPEPPKPPLTMDQLPAECRVVLSSGKEAPALTAARAVVKKAGIAKAAP